MIKFYRLLLLLSFFSLNVLSEEKSDSGSSSGHSIDLGFRFVKFQGLYYENGLTAQYSNPSLLFKGLFFGFSYYTSSLGSAFGNNNAIDQSTYILSTTYDVFSQYTFSLPIRLNLGYFYADYGDPVFDVLDNKSLIASLETALNYQPSFAPIKMELGLGYNFISGKGSSGPGTLYPIYYQLTMLWTIF